MIRTVILVSLWLGDNSSENFSSAASQKESKERTLFGQNFALFAFLTNASSCALLVPSANPHHAGEQY